MSRQPESDPNRPSRPSEVFTRQLLEARWGEDLGMSSRDLAVMWVTAVNSISEDSPYHNLDHTVETVRLSMEMADRCEANGHFVNRKILLAAALFHDSMYHVDHTRVGYESKEAHSAAIFRYNAHTWGFTEDEIKFGMSIIRATQVDQIPDSLEAKILLRADLDNIGHDYKSSFFENTLKIFKEQHGTDADTESPIFKKFSKGTVKLLATYLRNDLCLGEFDRDSYRQWVEKAHDNLTFLALTIEKNGRTDEDLLRALGRIAGIDRPGSHN